EMIRGTEVMKKQELIDAAEASGLSRKAIGPNNYKSKHGNSGSDFYTGWSCMKNLTEKDLVVKKSNPAKYYLTEKGKETARICLAKSGLDDPAGPFMATGHPESVMLSDSDSDEQEGSSPLIGISKVFSSCSMSFQITEHCTPAALSLISFTQLQVPRIFLKGVDFQTRKQAIPVPFLPTMAVLLILLFHLKECSDSNHLVQWVLLKTLY
uniref:Crossover junction endonuclease MUS81 n=1 Tax=Aegilops tauschii subsp. strangulata TaxID=200361 RepID=A0A453GME5_AEGTS